MADRNLSENSRRIARNTVLLYFRMFLLMAVGLYTSRVVLRSLGQIDFGVYGAVAGVVTLFTILTASMSGAISRFITFELGKNGDRLKLVFSTAVSIQLLLAAAIVLLADPIGSTLGGGEHGDYEIEGIGNDFVAETMDMSFVDQVIKVSDDEAFAGVKRLAAKEGIFAGSSSGATLAAAEKLAAGDARGNIVLVFADRAERYFSKKILA